MTQPSKVRTIVLTCSVAAITATGAWYGAGLKMKQDVQKVIKKQQEASPSDTLLRLSEARSALVAKKMGLEKKISELEAKQKIQMELPKT